jgi:hypothetical protein
MAYLALFYLPVTTPRTIFMSLWLLTQLIIVFAQFTMIALIHTMSRNVSRPGFVPGYGTS